MGQLKQLYTLVGKADHDTLEFYIKHYSIDEELANAYNTSLVIDYFKFYDERNRKNGNS